VTDYSLARVDEILTELVELVETARSVPMSASCVVPRERTLDLLDAVREVLPPEIAHARRLLSDRDQLLAEATQQSEELSTRTAAQAAELLTAARTEAYELTQAAQVEQAELVSAATVHQVATREASELRQAAEEAAARTRQEADDYAATLQHNSRGYAERTLSELAEQLRRMAVTADNGRAALDRVPGAPGAPGASGAVGPSEQGD
jgi:cell division septum initiation protein DivIVA